MPVTDKHPLFIKKQYEIKQIRDTLAGSSAIKTANSLYLPIPASMYANAQTTPQSGIAYDSGTKKDDEGLQVPWSHSIKAYQAYLQRARFPDITALIHRGLNGVASKKDPEFILPSSIEYLRESATKDGKSLTELFRLMISEVLSGGKIGLLVDVIEETNKLVIVPYYVESNINWKTEKVNGMDQFSLVVLVESVPNDDEFSHESCEKKYIVCRNTISKDGAEFSVFSMQDCYEDENKKGDVVIPLLRGVPFGKIPFVTASVSGTNTNDLTCPLIGVSDIAISIYQKDADMSNSEFLTCNPMLVFTGVDSDGDEVPDIIGSSVTWALPNADSKAFYVEPNSNCLAHMLARIKSLFDEAAQYGVSVLGSSSNGEAAETVKMRQASNGANLRTIINSCAEALKDILDFCEEWETNKEKTGTIEVKVDLDLTEMNMTPQEQTALLQSWMSGGISHKTYLDRLLRAGIKLAGDTSDGEILLIETQNPNLEE